MIKYLLAGAAAAAVVAIAPAIAQTAQTAPRPLIQRAPMAVHTRAEVGTHVQALFARLDADRDGYITRAEAEARRGDRRHRRDRTAKRIERRGAGQGEMFDRIDSNRDGSISRSEFEAAPMRHERRMVMRSDRNRDGRPDAMRADRSRDGRADAMRAMRGMRMGFGHLRGQMFAMADSNRDGRVSMQEASAAAYRHFDMADANRDGQVTRDERRQMRQRMRAERRPG